MALGTPSWLNLDSMERVLRHSEDDNSIQVIDIFSKPATSKGDNYASDMLRVSVEFTRKQGDETVTEKRSIIVKLAPDTGVRKDLIEKVELFPNEIMMMTDTLKKMNEMIGSGYRFNARCLYASKESPAYLIIEDLATLGFRMANRHAGLDLAHSILAVQGLAKFHGTSVALCEKYPNLKKQHAKGMFSPDYPAEFTMFFNSGVKLLADEVEKWPELGKRYSEKLRVLSDHIYEKGIKVMKLNEDEFNVLNHGDSWVNNMLFQYDDQGKPCGHIFVDFQLCVYNPPAIDLLYFLSTSPAIEVVENNSDLLLQEYHRTLSSTMKQVGCKTPTPSIDDLKKQFKERAVYGMIAAFTVLPIVVLEKDQAMDLEQLMPKGGEYTNPAYKGETYRKIMIKKIPIYDQMGLLDV